MADAAFDNQVSFGRAMCSSMALHRRWTCFVQRQAFLLSRSFLAHFSFCFCEFLEILNFVMYLVNRERSWCSLQTIPQNQEGKSPKSSVPSAFQSLRFFAFKISKFILFWWKKIIRIIKKIKKFILYSSECMFVGWDIHLLVRGCYVLKG